MEVSKDVSSNLKNHGIQPSYQRLKIFEYLLSNHTHPTADNIYQALKPQIPSLSKTTIYNTMKLFVESGIANAITIDEGETRYDAEMVIHGHFKCVTCGDVFDFETEMPEIKSEKIKDFNVEEYHIYFKGSCNKC
jgi:Fe2+ or Zn2+ uptake regulation protein